MFGIKDRRLGSATVSLYKVRHFPQWTNAVPQRTAHKICDGNRLVLRTIRFANCGKSSPKGPGLAIRIGSPRALGDLLNAGRTQTRPARCYEAGMFSDTR